MKIQYCSDLHLEFANNWDFIQRNPIVPIGDILVIAGDLCYIEQIDSPRMKNFFQFLSDSFQVVYYIPGNHEFYGTTDIALLDAPLSSKILGNVFLVNNYSVKIENVRLVFTTLWSHIYGESAPYIKRGLNDFHLINYHDERLTIDAYNQFHQSSVDFLREAVTNCREEDKIVVVTHHLPSFDCIAPEYQGSLLNLAFANDLNSFIQKSNIQYWIYGHSHSNVHTKTIGQTQLISNTLGYVSLNEHRLFNVDAVVEVSP
jgi:predicted phosphohydrolase